MAKAEHISHFAAAVVTDPTDTHSLACSPLLALAARRHQGIRLRRTVFRRRVLTRDVQIPQF